MVLLGIFVAGGLVAEEIGRMQVVATLIRRDCLQLTPGKRPSAQSVAGFHFEDDVRRARESASRSCERDNERTPGGSILHDVPYRGLCGCSFDLKPCTAEVVSVDAYACMGLD